MSGFMVGDVLKWPGESDEAAVRSYLRVVIGDGPRGEWARLEPDGSLARNGYTNYGYVPFRRCTREEWSRVAAAVEGVPPVLPEHEEPKPAEPPKAQYPKRIRITRPVGAQGVTVGKVYAPTGWGSSGAPRIATDDGIGEWCCALPDGSDASTVFPAWEPADEPTAAAGRVVAKYAVGDRVRAPSGLATIAKVEVYATYDIRYDGDSEDVGGYDDDDLSPAPADTAASLLSACLSHLPPALRKRAEAVLANEQKGGE